MNEHDKLSYNELLQVVLDKSDLMKKWLMKDENPKEMEKYVNSRMQDAQPTAIVYYMDDYKAKS